MKQYIGRFAPAPTGALHLGSLLTAVASYLQARKSAGLWLVRMEDIDSTRVVAGADKQILADLSRCGLEWDGEIIYQSSRLAIYEEVLAFLQAKNLIYKCNCSRKRLKSQHYDGHCRNLHITTQQPYSLRIKATNKYIQFTDELQGIIYQPEIDDFILKRKDGIFAYQLAVVVDDALQGVNHIVRGCDLLDTTARQLYLQQQLGYPQPRYAHIPVVIDANGLKLSKQNHAPSIEKHAVMPLLHQVLTLLGQKPPIELLSSPKNSFWDWAIKNWDMNKIPRSLTFSYKEQIYDNRIYN
jgi:glutamyl-Q tRNA(Asp) synthetase